MENIVLRVVYLFIMAIFLIKLVKDLRRKDIRNLTAGKIRLPGTEKYEKGHPGVAIVKKKDSPRLYWTGIAMDIILIILGIYIGYLIYPKIF